MGCALRQFDEYSHFLCVTQPPHSNSFCLCEMFSAIVGVCLFTPWGTFGQITQEYSISEALILRQTMA